MEDILSNYFYVVSGQRLTATYYVHRNTKYIYQARNYRQQSGRVNLYCIKPNCKGSVSCNSDGTNTEKSHNHDASVKEVNKYRFIQELKTKCQLSDQPLRQIYEEELQRYPTDVVPDVAFESIRRSLARIRQKATHSVSENLDMLAQENNICRKLNNVYSMPTKEDSFEYEINPEQILNIKEEPLESHINSDFIKDDLKDSSELNLIGIKEEPLEDSNLDIKDSLYDSNESIIIQCDSTQIQLNESNNIKIKIEISDEINNKDENIFGLQSKNQGEKLHIEYDSNSKNYEKNNHILENMIQCNKLKFSCHECDYESNVKKDFNEHKMSHKKVFFCDKCDYKCKLKGDLNVHKMIHSDEFKFFCDECDYKSKVKRYYIAHKKIHTNEFKFFCDECHYKTKVKRNLITHKMIHANEYKFFCDECGYKSRVKRDFNTHKNSHSNL